MAILGLKEAKVYQEDEGWKAEWSTLDLEAGHAGREEEDED